MQGTGKDSDLTGFQDRRREIPALKLPIEHGAVVAFLLAGVTSFQLSNSPYLFCCLFILLWLLFLSMHNYKQSACLALLFAGVALLVAGTWTLALPFLLMPTGAFCIKACSKSLGVSFRETAGMLGACSLPLLLAVLTNGNLAKTPLIACAFIASTMLGTAMIRLLRPDTRISPIPALIVFSIFFALEWAGSVQLAVLCLFPFAMQLPLLMADKAPSFKALGIMESLSLLYVTGFLAYWMH